MRLEILSEKRTSHHHVSDKLAGFKCVQNALQIEYYFNSLNKTGI